MGYDITLNQSVPVRWNFIQPGARMIYPEGCTMAFVLEPGDKITTAGHCVDDTPITFEQDVSKIEDDYVPVDTDLAGQLEPVWDQLPDPGANDVVLVAGEHAPQVLVHIGTALPEGENDISTNDWAVVQIKDDFLGNVDPAVKGIGGPVGVYSDPIDLQNAVPVKYIGWGVETPGVPRVGLAVREHTGQDKYNVEYLGETSKGDSGAPIIAIDPDQPNKPFGLALGIHSSSGVNDLPQYVEGGPLYTYTAGATRVTAFTDDYTIMTSGVPDPAEPTPPGWLTEGLSRVDECINDAAYLGENAPAAGEYDLCDYLTLFVPEIQNPWEPTTSGAGSSLPSAGACVYHWFASPCLLTDRTPSQTVPTTGGPGHE